MLSHIITAIAALASGCAIGAGAVGITAGRRIHHLADQLDAERAARHGGAR
ncbi:hypothetical protein [Microbispora sp. GKU 823]|uniref:hypothetical protein n=1 Tax=Microbispora sp. GKU 823 TaxID=1652100 RepID=UPI0015C48730|nr:hypothetical protein [Microbispora sp. GKU 823]